MCVANYAGSPSLGIIFSKRIFKIKYKPVTILLANLYIILENMDAINSVLSIDFAKIFIFVAIYLLVLWLLICVWVYNDAMKRFKAMHLAIIFFMLCLVLNFPALIFYLIIRPESEEEHVFYMHSDEEASNLGGVNVPIVNFIGEDGFKISLQLKVANPKADKDSNLDINLDWKSNDESMKVQEAPKKEIKVEETVVVKENKQENKPGFTAKIKNAQTSASNSLKGARSKVSLSMKRFSKKNQEVKPEIKKEEDKK
ncbi:MAG: hypothetical protein ABIM99_00910 [Candidatus Dojkabacteria bacterium]